MEIVSKISPVYIKHVKNFLEEEMYEPADEPEQQISKEEETEMAEFYNNYPHLKPKPKTKLPKQIDLTLEDLASLVKTVIKRIEFFSRKNVPEHITSGGKTAAEIETELNRADAGVEQHALTMLRNQKEFVPNQESEKIYLVRLKVKDLFPDTDGYPTIDQIFEKAKEFGLELCRPEDGPAYRLAYTPNGDLKEQQPMDEWIGVAMKPIIGSDGRPCMFSVGRRRRGEDIRLGYYSTGPTGTWYLVKEFVFRLPVPASKN